jgi:hypothetical protein
MLVADCYHYSDSPGYMGLDTVPTHKLWALSVLFWGYCGLGEPIVEVASTWNFL